MKVRIYLNTNKNKFYGVQVYSTMSMHHRGCSAEYFGVDSFVEFDLITLMGRKFPFENNFKKINKAPEFAGATVFIPREDFLLPKKTDKRTVYFSGSIVVNENRNGDLIVSGKNFCDIIDFVLIAIRAEIKPFPKEWLKCSYTPYKAPVITVGSACIGTLKNLRQKLTNLLSFLKKCFVQFVYYVESYFSELGRLYQDKQKK